MKKANGIFIYLADKKLKTILSALAAVIVLGIILFPVTKKSEAAAPAAGLLQPTGPSVSWVGTDAGGAAPNGEADCNGDSATSPVCDTFVLQLGGTLADWNAKVARVQINWTTPATDYDMYIHTGSENGPLVATSAAGTTTFEQSDLNPNSLGTLGPFYVRVVYFAAVAADQYSGIASVVATDPPFVPPASACMMPSFETYRPPLSVRGAEEAGEPSIGVNWNTGNVLFQAGFDTIRATYNDSTSPATVSWGSSRPNFTTSLDPIMFTDAVTGRTIPGQLLAAGGTSQTAITDNDGQSFTNTVTTGITSGVDHQTIGGGPYNENPIDANGNPSTVQVGPTTAYPHAFYYSSQSIAAATTARSDDGGVTYGPAVPMYNITQCSGLHGHVKVAPDGTVYVPNKNCSDPDMDPTTADGGQGFAVSEDNGLTWNVRTLPGSGSGDNDPAVDIGAGGRVYMAYTASDKTFRAAVSDDKGKTWKFDQDVGAAFGIKASVFPAAVAGDNDRAAIFFHGTDSTNPGDPTGTDEGVVFAGTWYAYVATTCNGGQSWSVARVGDPVQQGVICTNGTTCPSGTRNLLDFMDIKVDRFGRSVAGYADGCVSARCTGITDNSGTKADTDKKTSNPNVAQEYTSIIRQTGGSRLFSDFDTGGPAAPTLPPPVTVEAQRMGNKLSWKTPDDNGSPLTGYKIYRGAGNEKPALIGQVDADGVNSYADWNWRNGRGLRKGGSGEVYYQVTAVNKYGESPRTVKFYAPESSRKGIGR